MYVDCISVLTLFIRISVNSFSENRGGGVTSPPSTIASVKPTRRIQRSNSAEEITPSKINKVSHNPLLEDSISH